MMAIGKIILGLFAATSVIIFVYALLCLISVGISLVVIFRGRREFSKGYMMKFINAFSTTLAVSFLYAIWNVFLRLKIIVINDEVLFSLIDNLILVIFIMLLTYLAYLAREISRRFGFKSIGHKISMKAKK